MKRLPPDALGQLRSVLNDGIVLGPKQAALLVDDIEATENKLLIDLALSLVWAKREAELSRRASYQWKRLAKKLWRNPWSNKGGLGRYGCAAIDVRMKNNERTIKR